MKDTFKLSSASKVYQASTAMLFNKKTWEQIFYEGNLVLAIRSLVTMTHNMRGASTNLNEKIPLRSNLPTPEAHTGSSSQRNVGDDVYQWQVSEEYYQ